MALGVGPGDEVVTSPFSFFASAGVVARLGARPVFVDIEPARSTSIPSRLEAALSPRTKAIQPVHLYGQCADMDPILEIARPPRHPRPRGRLPGDRRDLPRAAAGTLGHDGRLLLLPDEEPRRRRRRRRRRDRRRPPGRVPAEPARARRPRRRTSTIASAATSAWTRVQAAVLRAKLPRLEAWNERRRAIARRYDGLFAEASRRAAIGLPVGGPGRAPRVPPVRRARRRIATACGSAWPSAGVASSVFYPVPLHLQACFRRARRPRGRLPCRRRERRAKCSPSRSFPS